MFQSSSTVRTCLMFALMLASGYLLFGSQEVSIKRQPTSIGARSSTTILASRYTLRQRTPNFYSRSKISYARSR